MQGTASGFAPETSMQTARFSGSFADAGYTLSNVGGTVEANIRKAIFDASLSNSIYSSSSKVQPKAFNLLMIIKN